MTRPANRPFLFAVLLAVPALPAAYFKGFTDARFQAALEENKVAASVLRVHPVSASAEFREYLKSRVYYNIATKYPNDSGYLLRRDWDFGPVDAKALPERVYAKDPTVECDSFHEATARLSRAERVPPSHASSSP